MKDLNNSIFIKTLKNEKVDTTPIWIMRQAGRYLPEYRKVRSTVDGFMGLCRSPEKACEVTLQPIRRYKLDASIVFSDILTVVDAMDLGLNFVQGEGPKVNRTIQSSNDLSRLKNIDVEKDLWYVKDTIELLQIKLPEQIPLIGFIGSPWTVGTYMIEGGSSKQFSHCKRLMYKEPNTLHSMLDHLTKQLFQLADLQVKAGVNALMIFDTWGGILSKKNYFEFSLNYMKAIVNGLQDKYKDLPIILFTKNGGRYLDAISNTNCQAIGLDWTADIKESLSVVGNKVALQGNMDPGVLLGDRDTIKSEAARIINEFGSNSRHIFNLGHGITPEVDPQNLSFLVDFVHEYSNKVRSS